MHDLAEFDWLDGKSWWEHDTEEIEDKLNG